MIAQCDSFRGVVCLFGLLARRGRCFCEPLSCSVLIGNQIARLSVLRLAIYSNKPAAVICKGWVSDMATW